MLINNNCLFVKLGRNRRNIFFSARPCSQSEIPWACAYVVVVKVQIPVARTKVLVRIAGILIRDDSRKHAFLPSKYHTKICSAGNNKFAPVMLISIVYIYIIPYESEFFSNN